MNSRFRSYRRDGGQFYLLHSQTGKRESLRTSNPKEAQRLAQARYDAHDHPAFNLQLARMFLTGADPEFARRKWHDVLAAATDVKTGPTHEPWLVAGRQSVLASLLTRTYVDTRPEHLLAILKAGTVSTNVFLRRFHNLAVHMGWLPAPLLHKKNWPAVRFSPKRAITAKPSTVATPAVPNSHSRRWTNTKNWVKHLRTPGPVLIRGQPAITRLPKCQLWWRHETTSNLEWPQTIVGKLRTQRRQEEIDYAPARGGKSGDCGVVCWVNEARSYLDFD